MDWRPRSPDSRAPKNQWETQTHIHLDQGLGPPHFQSLGDAKDSGPEDQGAPSSQRAGTKSGTPIFPGTVDSQKSWKISTQEALGLIA